MEPTFNIPDLPFDLCIPLGDEYMLQVSQVPMNDPRMFPTNSEALLHHNSNSPSNDIGSERDNEDPVYPFRFLDLPLEIQLDVVETLSELHENPHLSISMHHHRHPLLNLRQTNKHLNLISAPHLFSKLKIPSPYCEDLSVCAPTLGPLVKCLTITIGQGEEQPLPTIDTRQRLYDDYGPFIPDHHLIRLLPHFPSITSLELIYPLTDHALDHGNVLDQLTTYGPQITTIILRQQALLSEHYDEIAQSRIQQLFFDTLCHFALRSFPNVRVFEVHSAVSFTARFLAELRATGRNLRKLFVRMGVGLALRPLFSEVTPWSCGIHGHLRELTLRDCKGGHLGIVASHLATGVFGPGLRIVNLIVCGYPTDDQYAPLGPPALGEPRRRVKWDESLVPRLDRVHIDHTEPWELWALSAIRTREVIITRSDRRCVVAMLENPGKEDGEDALVATWIGLERLSVRDYALGSRLLQEQREDDELHENEEDGAQDEASQIRMAEWSQLDAQLAVACAKRGVELAFDGLQWGRCSCHPEG